MAQDYDTPPPIPFDDGNAASSPTSKPKSDDFFDATGPVNPAPSPRIQAFGTTAQREPDEKLHRQTQLTGRGATRTRTFHAKLNDGAMAFLDQQINEWLDQHPEYEVKFATTTIGVVEGKRQEPHLIINVWY
ncbi:MAG: hypothetical protein JW709_03910 [Sedimentisphaerales bacterium]|nr:hypothetical protein [Sedimentisphaerales bacterium]